MEKIITKLENTVNTYIDEIKEGIELYIQLINKIV